MTYPEMTIFFIFVILNTVLSFIAGQRSGKWDGIIGTLRFLKEENALKGKTSIKNFKKWPEPLQHIYTNPEEVE